MYLRMFFWRSESFFALTIFPSGAHRAAICMSLEQAFDPNITTFSERVNLLRMPARSVCLEGCQTKVRVGGALQAPRRQSLRSLSRVAGLVPRCPLRAASRA